VKSAVFKDPRGRISNFEIALAVVAIGAIAQAISRPEIDDRLGFCPLQLTPPKC
jgi:hypothetical protein